MSIAPSLRRCQTPPLGGDLGLAAPPSEAPLRNLVPLVGGDQVVAVDLSPGRLAEARAQDHAVACLSSLEEVLADDDIGAVALATPVATHAALARRCLEGRHVLVEKPLAHRSDQAAELAALAEDRGLDLMVGHTFLFSPRVERAMECLGRASWARAVRHLVPAQPGPSPQGRGCHLGPGRPRLLHPVPPPGRGPGLGPDAGRGVVNPRRLDVAFVNLAFPSGVIASVTVSWLSPRKVRYAVVVGDRKMLVYDDLDNEEPVKIYDKGVVVPDPKDFGEHQLTYRHGDVLAPHVPAHEPLGQELAHFLDCVEGKATCRSDGWFGLGVVEALEAAERSWENGGRVTPVRSHVPAPAAYGGASAVRLAR
ncbi:MAG: Gfo/Idh/MocA family protein [Acidimicrobiales bacterium]